MPSSKVWPVPLRVGTDVQVRTDRGNTLVGVISQVQRFKDTWLYRIEGDAFGQYIAHRVRPLDLSDPDDVEVFLNG